MQYSVMVKDEIIPSLIDRNSDEYELKLLFGWSEIYFGDRRSCERYIEDIMEDLAPVQFESYETNI